MIIIKSKREGFRRCGIRHPKDFTEYPDDKFSESEIALMEADPMLTVEHVKDPIITQTRELKDMTVPELKALMTELNLQYDTRITKPVLIEMIRRNTSEPPLEE